MMLCHGLLLISAQAVSCRSCTCGGGFDFFLRVMAGVLVVVGAVPSKWQEALNQVSALAGWFWG